MKKNLTLKKLIIEKIKLRFGFSKAECKIIADELLDVLKEYAYTASRFEIPGVCKLRVVKPHNLVILDLTQRLKNFIEKREKKCK